jgi:Protein of unknown function (DUF1573)
MMKQRYSRRFLTATSLTCMGLVMLVFTFWGAGAAPAAAAEPRMVLPETQYDFGTVFEDRPLIHTFKVLNQGEAPLKIRKVDPACSCTVAQYDRTIPPGGQGEITLQIKPYSVLRQFHKETRVWVNDPQLPEFTLFLTGVSMPFIEITPSHIVRLRGAPGDKLEGQVLFTSHLPGPFQITSYRTNIPDKIDISLKPVVPGRVYLLKVKNKTQNTAPYAGLIELFTTSKQRPRLIVRVFGEIYLPSASGQ